MKIEKKLYQKIVKKYAKRLEISTNGIDWYKCLYPIKLQGFQRCLVFITNNNTIEIYGDDKIYHLRIANNQEKLFKKEYEKFYGLLTS